MLKRHTVTLQNVITVYNNMFNHIDGVWWALAEKQMQWKEDLFITMEIARQKLYKYYAEVTPTTGRLLISAHILNSFRKLLSFGSGRR